MNNNVSKIGSLNKCLQCIKKNIGCEVVNIIESNFIIDFNSILLEANQNMFGVSFTEEQIKYVNQDNLIKFLNLVIANRKEIMAKRKVTKMYFYLWHDFQSGHLCFSFISQPKPPFGCKICYVDNKESIINLFLSEIGEQIKLSELEDEENDDFEDDSLDEQSLNVYIEELTSK